MSVYNSFLVYGDICFIIDDVIGPLMVGEYFFSSLFGNFELRSGIFVKTFISKDICDDIEIDLPGWYDKRFDLILLILFEISQLLLVDDIITIIILFLESIILKTHLIYNRRGLFILKLSLLLTCKSLVLSGVVETLGDHVIIWRFVGVFHVAGTGVNRGYNLGWENCALRLLCSKSFR